MGHSRIETGRVLDGRTWDEMPASSRTLQEQAAMQFEEAV